MIIADKIVIVYRVEVYKNATIVYLYNTEKDKLYNYVIDKDRNDSGKIKEIFKDRPNILFVGYQNHEFDNHIINYIISFNVTVTDIYVYSKEIPEDSVANKYFQSIDLCSILYSEKNRLNIYQLEYVIGKSSSPVKDEFDYQYDNLEIKSIYSVLCKNSSKIELRFELYKKYKINAINVDDILLGIRYITKIYLNKTKEEYQKFISGRTQPSLFKPKQFVKCSNSIKNPILRGFLNKALELTINPQNSGKKAWNESIITNNLKLSVGQGGIRTINNPESFICNTDKERIVYYDISSMFPTVMCNYSLFPRHLSQDFRSLYKSIRDERIMAKMERNKDKADLLKIVLNSAIGLMNADWNYMYDPVMFCCIRIQAMFIMIELIDLLLSNDIKIIQVNVDGIFIYTKDEKLSDKIVSDFFKNKDMVFEKETFSKMFQLDVNNYIASRDNLCVEKGLFSVENTKTLKPRIVTEAIGANLLYNTSIKEYIDKYIDINNAAISTNVGKDFLVKHGNKTCRNNVRYVYSTGRDSYKLTRYKDGKESIVDNLSGVTIIDNINKPVTINKQPYYAMANKVILQFKQKTLFSMILKNKKKK